MITSAKIAWFDDPNTYVIMVESENGEKVFGGARIQIGGGDFRLPIEDALGRFDPNIFSYVKDDVLRGTGELCGLWNSREVAGLGIGSIYLSRVGVSISSQLNLSTLYALCAPATVKNATRVGFLVDERLGDKGTFYYPKEGLVATAVRLSDVNALSTADPDERGKILELRQTPELQKTEVSPRGQELDIDYRLALTSLV